jgi:predicted DNA-binding protein
MTKDAREKQTPFRFAPVVKERLRKIAKYQGVDMVVVVSMLINKEYIEHKDDIEEFVKNYPLDEENEE